MDIPPRATERAYARLAKINADRNSPVYLRVAVEGGGCSGFQYDIKLTDEIDEADLILVEGNQKILIDAISRPFLAGATIDYTQELIGSRFIIDNPNAISSCGCGTSFAL